MRAQHAQCRGAAQATTLTANAAAARAGGDQRRPPVGNAGGFGAVVVPGPGQQLCRKRRRRWRPPITPPSSVVTASNAPFARAGSDAAAVTGPDERRRRKFPSPVPGAANPPLSQWQRRRADIGSARRYIAAGTFGSYWIPWDRRREADVLSLPLSFLLANPAGAISQLSFMNLLDIFNRTGKDPALRAEAQSWAMMGLFGVAMLVTGPLIIWFNAGCRGCTARMAPTRRSAALSDLNTPTTNGSPLISIVTTRSCPGT